MKCEKCGYSNSEYDIICEKCGAPLSIENNIELQKKYNNKQRAIDIEHITPDHSEEFFNRTKKQVSIVALIVIVIFLLGSIGLGVYIYKETRENSTMVQFEQFISTKKIGIIYIGNEEEINKKIEEYKDMYNLEYIYFNSDKLSKLKKSRMKNILDIKDVNNTVIITKDGKVKDYITDSTKLDIFLQQNEVIPKYLGDAKEVISIYEKNLVSEKPVIMYVANNKNDSNNEHNKLIEEFCKKYEIDYIFIEGYYLTDSQKIKLLNKINYNEIHDELIIIVDESKVLKVSETLPSYERDYFEIISSYGIIDERSIEQFKDIDYDSFEELIDEKNKSIVLIESDDCNYCEKLKPILGKLSMQYNFNIYSLKLNDDNKSKIEEKMKDLDLEDSKIVTPLTVVVGENQLLGYVVGLSDKKIYIDKFTELGVIR